MEEDPVPTAPVFRTNNTLCLSNLKFKFASREKIEDVYEQFFCPKDPYPSRYSLSIAYGSARQPKCLSAFITFTDRKVIIRSKRIQVFDEETGALIHECSSELQKHVKKNVPYGWRDFAVFDSLTNSSTWMLVCEFEYFGTVPVIKTPESPPTTRFQKEFLRLLETGDQADVTFNVQGVKIKAHKVILTTRCDYFRSMFDSGMQESNLKEVDVVDVEAKVFKGLLKFIYTGILPTFRQESTMALLTAADKYGVEDLKENCESLLCSHLAGDNIIESLLLAEKHCCSKLMTRAVKDFGSYVSVLKKQEKWNRLKESPSLLLQLLEQLHLG